jgi:hypothetical protein
VRALMEAPVVGSRVPAGVTTARLWWGWGQVTPLATPGPLSVQPSVVVPVLPVLPVLVQQTPLWTVLLPSVMPPPTLQCGE